MKPEETIKRFRDETGYTLKYKDGKYNYGGSLDLRGTQITSLPDNLTVGGWLDLQGTQVKKEKYTIREMIELTNGRYGNGCFKEFFKK